MNQIKYGIKHLNKLKLLFFSLSLLGMVGLNSPAYGNDLNSIWEKVDTINGDLQSFQSKYRQWANSVQRVIRQIQSVNRENKKLQEEIDYIKQNGRQRSRHHQNNDHDRR